MTGAYLVAQDLHKSFNEQKAVDGVSFFIDRGEMPALPGFAVLFLVIGIWRFRAGAV
jgi:hypothetical protein